MPWKIIYELIGPEAHWAKPRQLFLDAIAEAERRGHQDAADHIRIMLDLRDTVNFDKPKAQPPSP